MPIYVIERDLPGAGELTADQLADIAAKSNSVVDGLDVDHRWLHSYVTDDRLYCVREAPDVATVREHADRGGFPVSRVSMVHSTIDPTTATAGG
ncbi:DUF4242 domain-containing protein [Nocardiopsis oceani]